VQNGNAFSGFLSLLSTKEIDLIILGLSFIEQTFVMQLQEFMKSVEECISVIESLQYYPDQRIAQMASHIFRHHMSI
jgi:hypothetical protein